MRTLVFASRNRKEILRDKLNLLFGIGFPVVLLLLLSAIQSNIPVSLFEIEELTPGIAIFGLSFISLFSGMLIAKDRTSSFMLRLFTSPLSARNFIFGYLLPLIPMALAQVAMCFMVAFLLGLPINIHVVVAIIVTMPAAILFIAIGLLCGSLMNEKQVGGICGALLTNLSAWLSGTWFNLELVGGIFERIAEIFPFIHAVRAGRAALAGEYAQIMPDLWWVIAYAVIVLSLAIFVFTRKMNGDK